MNVSSGENHGGYYQYNDCLWAFTTIWANVLLKVRTPTGGPGKVEKMAVSSLCLGCI